MSRIVKLSTALPRKPCATFSQSSLALTRDQADRPWKLEASMRCVKSAMSAEVKSYSSPRASAPALYCEPLAPQLDPYNETMVFSTS